MKLYITRTESGWGEPGYRGELLNTPQADYNAQGIFDLDPTPGPEVDYNTSASCEVYLDTNNIARYRWTTTLKTGDALKQATRDKWAFVRAVRNELLAKSDYTQLVDSPMPGERRAAWAAYRQALRDITTQADPFALVWPTDPNGVTNTMGVARV